MHADTTNRSRNKLLFMGWLVLVLGFFCWTRFDASNHLYYFGDGNIIVELIRLILQSGDWDPNWERLVGIIHLSDDVLALGPPPNTSLHTFYNLSGYTVIGALACRIVYALGFTEIPIQSVLHGLNVLLQFATLAVLFQIGRRLVNIFAGLLAMTLFTVFPLAVMESHYERPESWLCLLATAVILVAIHAGPASRRGYLAIGTLIGLSVASRVSQLFLGIIPAILLAHYLFANRHLPRTTLARSLSVFSACVLGGMVLALLINAPFILANFREFIVGFSGMNNFYRTPTYPYAEQHYSYIGECLVIGRYFLTTLGPLWCACIILGLLDPARLLQQRRLDRIIIILPLLLYLLHTASLKNFIERNFSSMEGVLVILAALGLYAVYRACRTYLSHPVIATGVFALLCLATLWPAARLDIILVQQYLKHPEHTPRIDFQEQLKQDFPGFWIKNLSFTHNVTQALPENPGKAPRLYQIEDLNEFHARQFIDTMKADGFAWVAQYCSEFRDLPPGNLTIYHAAARNNYFVRLDEWPASLPKDYFRTNCQ